MLESKNKGKHIYNTEQGRVPLLGFNKMGAILEHLLYFIQNGRLESCHLIFNEVSVKKIIQSGYPILGSPTTFFL